MDTRGRMLKGVMDYRLLWATLTAAPLFHVEHSPESLEGVEPFPFSLLLLCCLGLRGFSFP